MPAPTGYDINYPASADKSYLQLLASERIQPHRVRAAADNGLTFVGTVLAAVILPAPHKKYRMHTNVWATPKIVNIRYLSRSACAGAS